MLLVSQAATMATDNVPHSLSKQASVRPSCSMLSTGLPASAPLFTCSMCVFRHAEAEGIAGAVLAGPAYPVHVRDSLPITALYDAMAASFARSAANRASLKVHYDQK